jgi:hypothetical protein
MLCNWIEAVVPHCPRLKTLVFGRFLSSQLKAGRQLFDLQSLPAPIAFTNNTIEEVNYRLGVEATNRRAHAGPRDVQWQWIAEARKALTWKKRDEGHTEG